jgi:hypothetical protein
MKQYEINVMLEEAYEKEFLDMILFLKKEEKEYKTSEFYKETKIPLMELYKNYFEYKKSQENFIEKYIKDLNEDLIEEKISLIIDKLENNELIKEKLNQFLGTFNLEQLVQESEELFKNLKNEIK